MFSIHKNIKQALLIPALLASSALAGGPQSHFAPSANAAYAPHEVLIRFADRSAMESSNVLSQIRTLLPNTLFQRKNYENVSTAWIHSDQYTVSELVEKLRTVTGVVSIDPNYIRHVMGSTNDTYYNDLWAIENRGQDGGTVDADIDGKEAWDIEQGSRDVVVAVLDTGIDYNHPELADNMWDGSAYGAPHHGWDFAGDSSGNNDDDPNPGNDDDLKHGTHVAGTIGAVANNNRGVAGVSQFVSLMAVKVFRPNGNGYDSDVLEGINYIIDLADQGVNIVAANASYGGGGSSSTMRNAIEDLGEKGVVFCAAAGNDDNNNDSHPQYPASYDLDNIISVAATDRNDELASFSNYGEESVDVAAPGVEIKSTVPGNGYATWNGTSMATPHVAGLVALLAAHNPDSSVSERIEAITSSVDTVSSLDGKVATGGRINARAALEAIGGGGDQNHAPIANAGSDQQVDQGDEVTLDGSSSRDTDGDALTYQWRMVSKPSGSDAVIAPSDTVHPTFTADVSGDYVVELIVNDGETNSAPDRVTITAVGDVTTWSTGAYGNNEDRRQELRIAGATRLSVHIEGETEDRYDFIYIYDADGNQIAKLDGNINETLTVDGVSITARLTSDGSVTKDGVTVTITEVDDGGGDDGDDVTTWSTGAYGNNEDRRQELRIAGATRLSVHIEGETEDRYDFIYIYDADGNQIAKLDGNINETLTVDGASITARLTSDGSVTKDGVTVTITEVDDGGGDDGDDVTTWSTGAYGNNEDRRQELRIAGATRLSVHIEGETEDRYDFIYIYDADGNQIAKLDGNINETLTVDGASITARLTSDGSVTKDGVTVTITEVDDGGGDDGDDVTTWSTGAYGNNEDRRQELRIAGATRLSVHIEGETEDRYDFIYIYDADGNQIAKLDGNINETLTVDGASITARLTSDGSVTKDGVTVTISSL